MSQIISSQIVDVPVMIPTTQQTVPQQDVVNISIKYLFVLANQPQNLANSNIQQHSFANPSVPQQQPAKSSVYQQNLANSSMQHQILVNPSLQQQNVVVNQSVQYQTLANLPVKQQIQQKSHLTSVYVQQQQVANLSRYQQNLANSSTRHQTFANLPAQENDAVSSFTRLQQLAKTSTYKQNTANPFAQQLLLLANQPMSRKNLRHNLCHADCADCLQIVANNLQNIKKNQYASTGRNDTINNSTTNAQNSRFNSMIETSKLQNNNSNISNKRSNQQEFTDTQNLPQKSFTPIAPQTSTSQNSKRLQNTTCDTLSGKTQARITLNKFITSNKFYLDLGFLTDIQKLLLCKQLGSNYKILMWIRKNASKNISEKLDETTQLSLFLHKYMRQRTNEILKDYCSDNQLQNSSTPISSVTEKISKENVEISITKQLSEHLNVPEDDSITNTSCNKSRAEKTKPLDMPEIDEDSNENPEFASSNVNNKKNMCKTSKNLVINIENNAHFSCNNENQSDKVDNILDDVHVTRNNNEESINQSKSKSQNIISYAPRSSTPIASSYNLKPFSLNGCECIGISQTCVHCKDTVGDIMGLRLDTEQDKNEKALSVANSRNTSDEGCDFDPERLVIDEQDDTVTCTEEDNHVSDATLSQPRVLEDNAMEADLCQTTNETQDTSNRSAIQLADIDTISTEFEDAIRKAANVDTHSGVKTINKIFERVVVYKRHASPRISARKLRAQLESTSVNVRGYASNEDDSLSSECASNTDHNATLQSLSDIDNHNKEDSKDNCEVSDEKSDDEMWNTSEKDNDKLTTKKHDTHTPYYFTDYEMISDYEEDTISFLKAKDDVTLQSPDTNVKEDLFTRDALNNEYVPKIEENTTLQLAVENQNKEDYKDNCKVSGEESYDKASNNINKKEEYKSTITKTDLHTNYTDNEEIFDITEHKVISPKTEDDIALQFPEDTIIKENMSVEDKSENVSGAENARNKYVPNTEENVTLQLSSTVENQTDEEYIDNCEASVDDSDISKKDRDTLVIINENRTPCSNELNADSTEDNVTLLEEFQFDENILSPETTFQIEDAFNNKLALDTELSATLQFQIGTEDQSKEEHNNNDHDISSETSDKRTCNNTEDISTSNSTELSNNSEKNIRISESDMTKLSCNSRQNYEAKIVPTILKVQTISESMFNEMDISSYASKNVQNNAKKVDSKNEISQVNVEVNVEENKINFVKGDNDTKSDNEHIPCLRCKRISTVYCKGCLSAPYCSKRCAGLHWKSQHHKICMRRYDPL